MTLEEVMQLLAEKGDAGTKRTFLRHGAKEPLFGVRIGDLKPIAKQLRGEQKLAMQLYATKNSDAMYLAGMIADGAQMTAKQLEQWASKATWHMIAGYTVPWVASEHAEAVELGLGWIDSNKEMVAVAGWGTLAAVACMQSDDTLPIKTFEKLLGRCVKEIAKAPNRVRAAMNSFVICVGTYVKPLGDKAIATARKISPVEVDVGDTDCKIPDAESYILKSRRGAAAAAKRKTIRC